MQVPEAVPATNHRKRPRKGLSIAQTSVPADVYVRPGASLAEFSQVGLKPCSVAFRSNWRRDQNRSSIDLRQRVSQQDVDDIKDWLSGECDTLFREALLEDPAYDIVDDFSRGQAVMVIEPKIVDLDIAAPASSSAGRGRTYTASAGEMTLILEISDGTNR